MRELRQDEDDVECPVHEEGGEELPGTASEQLPAVKHPLPLLHPPLTAYPEEAQLRALGGEGEGAARVPLCHKALDLGKATWEESSWH